MGKIILDVNIYDRVNDPKLIAGNIERYQIANDLLSKNIKFLIKRAGYTRPQFYELINSKGIKGRVKAINNFTRNRRTYTSLFWIVTIAHIFNINPGLLISIDISEHPQYMPVITDGTI